jgi:hypothetical protein
MRLKDFFRKLTKYKMFLITAIFISILLTSNIDRANAFTSFSPMPETEEVPVPEPTAIISGNTGGNILNFGGTVFDGTYVYYRRQSDGFKLYREKADETGLQKVASSNGSFLNVSGEWIYYSNLGIFKTKKDGTVGTEKLSSDNPDSIHLFGEYLYYTKSIPDTGARVLCKIKVDGTGLSEIKVADKSILGISFDRLNVFDGWIYTVAYTKDDFGTHKSGLYKIRINGSFTQKILDNYPDKFFVDNGWVYYKNSKGIFKIRIDGTENTLMVPETLGGNIYSINSQNDFLYYTVTNSDSGSKEDTGVYRIRKNGADIQKLKGGRARYLTISADWIYFDDGDKNYRMKIDGTELTIAP